jgi:putative flippase GtrA
MSAAYRDSYFFDRYKCCRVYPCDMLRFSIVILCFSLCIIAGLFSTTLSLQTYGNINYGIATTVAILILLVANYLSSQFTIMKSFQSCRETNSDDTINRLESIESITLLASILLTVLVSIGIDMYSELQNTIIIFGLVFCVFILSTIFINGFCIRAIENLE